MTPVNVHKTLSVCDELKARYDNFDDDGDDDNDIYLMKKKQILFQHIKENVTVIYNMVVSSTQIRLNKSILYQSSNVYNKFKLY